MPTISIIVPVYNVEPYLRRCVDSILAQTFSDFELILVDDGSPDNCGAICDEYARKDSRIVVIHQENGGLSAARNAGIDHASGEYIAFCDADDYWGTNWLEALFLTITASGVDCVSAGYSVASEEGKQILGVKQREIDEYRLRSVQEQIDFIATKIVNASLGWEVTTRMFINQIITKHRIRFCENCENFAEDLGFTLEYTLCSNSAKSIENSDYYYRQRKSSMMHQCENTVKLNALNEVSKHVKRRFDTVIKEGPAAKQFPVIHFLIMNSQYSKIIGGARYQFLAEEVEKIQDRQWYLKQTKAVFRRYQQLKRLFGEDYAKRILLLSNYCLHGNWKRFKIESALYYKVVAKS